MNFDSVFFLSCFLPVLIVLYLLVRQQRWRNYLLLAAGLLFYAFGSLQGLLILVAAASVNYLLGLLLQRGICPRLVRTGAVASVWAYCSPCLQPLPDTAFTAPCSMSTWSAQPIGQRMQIKSISSPPRPRK